VLDELDRFFASDVTTDVITLAGSGEPTLHTRFGEVLDRIRGRSTVPAVLLSNGTLFPIPDVRTQAARAHVVKVSLSAWDPTSFARVNRPHPALHFDAIVESYRSFRSEFDGKFCLEVFLIPGTNTAPDQVARIAELARAIGPDVVQLNTAVRPPAAPSARALTADRMEELARIFQPPAEVIAAFASPCRRTEALDGERVLRILDRRPCTADQLASVSGVPPAEAIDVLAVLEQAGRIRPQVVDGDTYYVRVPADPLVRRQVE
jgi:wyosine [tRNA(Phe)-imidazoG37] synthetase (radical SAM superfamily)